MDKWLSRQKRIMARQIQGKTLPDYVYRLDKRDPAEIRAADGFKPWNIDGNISLVEHVTRTFQGGASQGGFTQKHSQWVSTGAYRMFQPMEGVFAQGILEGWVYKIDTRLAMRSGAFVDVNDHFDRAGIDRPYAAQREWIKTGSIPAAAIAQYIQGRDFYAQFQGSYAPDEDAVTGWIDF